LLHGVSQFLHTHGQRGIIWPIIILVLLPYFHSNHQDADVGIHRNQKAFCQLPTLPYGHLVRITEGSALVQELKVSLFSS